MKINKYFFVILVAGAILPFLISFWAQPTWILKKDAPYTQVTYHRPEDGRLLPFEFPFQYRLYKSAPAGTFTCDPPGSNNCIGSGAYKDTNYIDPVALGLDLVIWIISSMVLSLALNPKKGSAK